MHELKISRRAAMLGLTLGMAPGVARAQAPKRGGTAVFTLSEDPTTINPVVSSDIPERQLGCIIYEGLVAVTDEYKIVPVLARSWTISPDGLIYNSTWPRRSGMTGSHSPPRT